MKRPHPTKRAATKLDYCEICRLWHDPRKPCISDSDRWDAAKERMQDVKDHRIRGYKPNSKFRRANPGLFKGK